MASFQVLAPCTGSCIFVVDEKLAKQWKVILAAAK